MTDLFYESDEDVVKDFELQAWVREMRAADGAAIAGLPVAADGTLATRDQLRELIERRNRRLENPYTAMSPAETFNSIWN